MGVAHEPLVVAEIGINHGGDLAAACAMAVAAAAAGAEIVKRRAHVLEDEMTDKARSIIPGNTDVSIWAVMERRLTGFARWRREGDRDAPAARRRARRRR